jgi:hypothetical protein
LIKINHVRTAFFTLYALAGISSFFDYVRRFRGGDQFESHVHEFAGDLGDVRFVVVGDADEEGALRGQLLAGGDLGFGEGFAEIVGHAHDFSGGLHLGAEDGVHAGKFVPRKNRGLHVVPGAGVEVLLLLNVLGQKFPQLAPNHESRRNFRHRNPRRL